MSRFALTAAAAGAFGATLLVAALQGSVLGVTFGLLFSPLPLAMAVLGLGPAALPVAVLSGAVTAMVLTGSVAAPVVYILNDALPVALLTRLVRPVAGASIAQGVLLGRGVMTLAILAAGLVVIALYALAGGPDGIEAALRSRVDEILAEFAKRSTAEPARVEAAMKTLETVAMFLPSGAGWNWCLRAIASAAVAQAILTRMGRALETTPAYRQMALPSWFFGVFWAVILVGWLVPGDIGYVAKNAAGVLCLPVVFQGLCVVHSALGRKANAGFWLVGFYLLALSLATVSFAMLVGVGVADQFLKLRERMAAAGQGGV